MYLVEFQHERKALIDAQVRTDRLQLLFRQTVFSVLGSFLAAVMLSWLCWSRIDHALVFGWLMPLGASTALRVALLVTYFRSPVVTRTPECWELKYWLTLVLSATIWGLGALALMRSDDLLIQALVLLFTVGMSVSAVSCYSAYRSMTIVSIGLVLLPCSLWLLFQQGTMQVGMAVASLVFASFVITATRRLSEAMETAFRLTREMEHARDIANQAAQTDELTGMKNRRAFFHHAEQTYAHGKRNRQPISALMLDIDHFKRINDSYGHQAGDQVLRQIGVVISECAKEGDICGRLGGEEFALLLVDTSLIAAEVRAEQLRQSISRLCCDHGEVITASIGVASMGAEGQSVHALLNDADKALFRAKAQGRNQTAVA
ncbi:diguanylate cyclase [Pseudomonas sp. SLFW]|uniref:GGDEF domain-containing protein n=1 Tax=Pseudomonas sp. SLFW TaxID=2683259 RepID=UPI0014136667|nr:GGDEF domain-containing protein [Pseudomonas sp. SLFW]NBB09241.1 diguanylate cyclase [Pseudomonas sp. SLFW]